MHRRLSAKFNSMVSQAPTVSKKMNCPCDKTVTSSCDPGGWKLKKSECPYRQNQRCMFRFESIMFDKKCVNRFTHKVDLYHRYHILHYLNSLAIKIISWDIVSTAKKVNFANNVAHTKLHSLWNLKQQIK